MSDSGHRALEISPRRVLALRGDLLTVTLVEPVPPGSRVEIRDAGSGARELVATGKVVAVRLNRDGGVEIDVRLHNLSREQRASLASVISPPA
jgi:hypothetical protein